MTGSTGSRQRTQQISTISYPIPNQSEKVITDYCLFADSIYALIETNGHKSAIIENAREALLPKLMSGGINVSRAEV